MLERFREHHENLVCCRRGSSDACIWIGRRRSRQSSPTAYVASRQSHRSDHHRVGRRCGDERCNADRRQQLCRLRRRSGWNGSLKRDQGAELGCMFGIQQPAQARCRVISATLRTTDDLHPGPAKDLPQARRLLRAAAVAIMTLTMKEDRP